MKIAHASIPADNPHRVAQVLADILQAAKGDIKEALSSFQSAQLRYGHELHQYGVALGNRWATVR